MANKTGDVHPARGTEEPVAGDGAALANAEAEQRHFNQTIAMLEAERERVSSRLERLRENTLGVIKRRERVPQPLFWSLFHAELAEIKKRKAQERKARLALLGTEDR